MGEEIEIPNCPDMTPDYCRRHGCCIARAKMAYVSDIGWLPPSVADDPLKVCRDCLNEPGEDAVTCGICQRRQPSLIMSDGSIGSAKLSVCPRCNIFLIEVAKRQVFRDGWTVFGSPRVLDESDTADDDALHACEVVRGFYRLIYLTEYLDGLAHPHRLVDGLHDQLRAKCDELAVMIGHAAKRCFELWALCEGGEPSFADESAPYVVMKWIGEIMKPGMSPAFVIHALNAVHHDGVLATYLPERDTDANVIAITATLNSVSSGEYYDDWDRQIEILETRIFHSDDG